MTKTDEEISRDALAKTWVDNLYRIFRRDPVTRRRLADGERALVLAAGVGKFAETATRVEIEQQLEVIDDGIRALQSLDDLGSEEANRRAWADMLELQERHAWLKAKADRMVKP